METLFDAPAGPQERRLAIAVAVVSFAVCLGLAPFATIQLARYPAFVPLYQAALVVCDLITATLLFTQWRVSRRRAVYILGCGYLFTALMIVAHTLTFPGLFAPSGLLGAGAQSTAWLYMFWHALFPLFVVGYARAAGAQGPGNAAAAAGFAATIALAAALCALATLGESRLPSIMAGDRYRAAYDLVVGSVWLCSAVGLLFVWRKRPRTMLDVWVAVVMCVWVCEIALAAVFNGGRFDLGFYAGRIYGLLAASFLLIVLIDEWRILYARLATASAEREARIRAEAANRSKDEFLAILGHELRNPLAPIVTALQLMRMRDNNALANERLIIERQVQHMRRLVDDLLDISRLTRGKIELQRSTCEAADLAARAAEMAMPLIEAGRQRFSVDAPATGLAMQVDSDRIAQALCNLLSNAAKFTPPEGRIWLSAERDADRIAFRVRDTGKGIEADLLQRLFEPFSQGPQSFERAQGGLGLGLAIAKSIATLHGGSIEASSPGPGQGSEFILRVPAAQPGSDKTANAASAASRPTVAVSTLKVLVVDDNADAASTLAQALRMHGMAVRVAHDGAEALEAGKELKPDVALIDLGLPGVDGIEVARRLRRLPGLARVRIAALTGYARQSDRQLTAQAGFAAHFVKPIEIDQVLGFLAQAEPRAQLT